MSTTSFFLMMAVALLAYANPVIGATSNQTNPAPPPRQTITRNESSTVFANSSQNASPASGTVPVVTLAPAPEPPATVPYLTAPVAPSPSAPTSITGSGKQNSSSPDVPITPRNDSFPYPIRPVPVPGTDSSNPVSPPGGNKIIPLTVGFIASAGFFIICAGLVWLILRWKMKHESVHAFDMSFTDELENGMGPKKFCYSELVNATNNFGKEQKLGEGGFGAVYKGFLRNLNIYVAVKRISRRSKQGSKEYQTEVKIISRLRHKNTVKLIGWCHEKELFLVYEFMPNGSLDSHLFKGKSFLTWAARYKIVQDVALALLYLHEEGDHCVLHRDIKSSNIMLDSDFNAKLGDFGLARLVDHARGSQTTDFAGTMGYMAPECLTAISKASKKSDVFGFGVVALEIACGRRSVEHNYEEDQVSLVPWVWEAYGNGRLLDIVDKKLCMNFDINQMECLMIVGLWCAHPDRNLRPPIRQVIQVLNFELPLPNLPPKMPVFKFEIARPAVVASMGREPSQSLTIPR